MEEQLGFFKIELLSNSLHLFYNDSVRLQAVSAICALYDIVLPEREHYEELSNSLIICVHYESQKQGGRDSSKVQGNIHVFLFT